MKSAEESVLSKNAKLVTHLMDDMVKSFMKNKEEFEREWKKSKEKTSKSSMRKTHGTL